MENEQVIVDLIPISEDTNDNDNVADKQMLLKNESLED